MLIFCQKDDTKSMPTHFVPNHRTHTGAFYRPEILFDVLFRTFCVFKSCVCVYIRSVSNDSFLCVTYIIQSYEMLSDNIQLFAFHQTRSVEIPVANILSVSILNNEITK